MVSFKQILVQTRPTWYAIMMGLIARIEAFIRTIYTEGIDEEDSGKNGR